ncbi:MAG: zinc carboxypeptidase [Bacteroidia bacterium]|nr:zinc carboxypeptidase [Bacteroidia bacterium]
MKNNSSFSIVFIAFLLLTQVVFGQDYYFKNYQPFDESIPSPEEYLGYKIGDQHTRHDLIVAYFQRLADLSERATITEYGKTHEGRKLLILTISDPENMSRIEDIKAKHLTYVDPKQSPKDYEALPVFVQLGYNVHGNEPSGGEAAILMAYTLVASKHPEVSKFLKEGVFFIDPVINPDGRDRHTQWANQYKGNPLVADRFDAEHNEMWPRGRTNHFWFDLNRDWLLAIHPESRGKLNWYHEWYPNVVTDFHEMGTNSHYFFEPMKPIGSKEPIMPRKNFEDLNDLFAGYFAKTLDSIGSLYFTKEAFDGTYPGYGSSYPDLQGALALLFEQASSRGHLQETSYGKDISFPFTIRNQYLSSFATIRAAVENKGMLREYQQEFFKSAVSEKVSSGFKAYEFEQGTDKSRLKAFLDKLLIHRIKVYKKGTKFIVPVNQPQRRMVQTVFETYRDYRDSVFYDASAWSLANFYNIPYKGVSTIDKGVEVTDVDSYLDATEVKPTNYAYIIDGNDYNSMAAIASLHREGVAMAAAFKPFSIETQEAGKMDFNYGSVIIPIQKQTGKLKKSEELLAFINKEIVGKLNVPVYSTKTGFSSQGLDLGSNNFEVLEKPKALMLIGEGVRSYDAGEVWHLLDTRVGMPITKVRMSTFPRLDLNRYNVLVMVAGNYSQLDSNRIHDIKNWVKQGNTLITVSDASKWAIQKELVREKLTEKPKVKGKKEDSVDRLPYVSASENLGREELGGAIFEVDLDISHPLGFGYTAASLPVYKNNEVFLQPSKSPYGTVAKYSKEPHIDGYISKKNYDTFLKPSASLIVSPVGRGRVVMFADNPNFRGSWYGTNRLFLNAIMLGNHIRVPAGR